jgi:hypothetical protein
MFRLSPRSFRLTRSPRNRCRLKVRRDLFSELSAAGGRHSSLGFLMGLTPLSFPRRESNPLPPMSVGKTSPHSSQRTTDPPIARVFPNHNKKDPHRLRLAGPGIAPAHRQAGRNSQDAQTLTLHIERRENPKTRTGSQMLIVTWLKFCHVSPRAAHPTSPIPPMAARRCRRDSLELGRAVETWVPARSLRYSPPFARICHPARPGRKTLRRVAQAAPSVWQVPRVPQRANDVRQTGRPLLGC